VEKFFPPYVIAGWERAIVQVMKTKTAFPNLVKTLFVVLFFIGFVDFFASMQFIFMLHIPLEGRFFIVPTVLGAILGVLFASTRHYYRVAQERLIYEELAKVDTLTGAMTRHRCEVVFDIEIKRQQRSGEPLAVIMVDIDNFKQINDRFGHLTGDQVLRGVYARMVEVLRELDSVCRWGGEEFLLLLPGTDGTSLGVVAEKLRNSVASHDFGLDEPVTISLGGTMIHDAAEGIERVIERADDALYRAKAAGKNCFFEAS